MGVKIIEFIGTFIRAPLPVWELKQAGWEANHMSLHSSVTHLCNLFIHVCMDSVHNSLVKTKCFSVVLLQDPRIAWGERKRLPGCGYNLMLSEGARGMKSLLLLRTMKHETSDNAHTQPWPWPPCGPQTFLLVPSQAKK